MKAAYYERSAPPDEAIIIAEIDPPADPEPGEVLVRVAAAGVNPIDAKMLARGAKLDQFERIIPFSDGGGVIEAVGEGVPETRIGERVWLYGKVLSRVGGTGAELTVLPAEQAVPLADGTSLQEAACIGIPMLTAYYSVFAAGPVDGQTILVHGGAGGVGNYAIQLAKWGQAERVITTVSSPEKAEYARKAGADDVINYKEVDFAERVMEITAGEGVHLISDVAFGVNIDANANIIKDHGTITAYAPGPDRNPRIPWNTTYSKSVSLIPFVVFNLPPNHFQQGIRDINAGLEAGAFTHFITPLALDQTAEGMRLIMSGELIGGKIIINVSG